ncbi:MAG: prepilin-type N-terminal cleavage/methylation domain-containing protein [Gemmatimonadota bacterium]
MQTARTLRKCGFTLVEMLIVVTMIGIMTGIALWRVDIARYQVNGDIQSIGTTLIASQREAIAKQHNVIVVFDTAGNRLRIVWDANNNGAFDDGEHSRMVYLGDRVRFGLGTAPAMAMGGNSVNFTDTESSTGLPAVTFYRNGSASEAGGAYITSLRSIGDPKYVNDNRAMRVERATGRAEWWHYDGTTWVRGF